LKLNYIDNIDCMEGMAAIPDGTVDLVLTDPPYSSGGAFSGDRKSRTSTKYTSTEHNGAAALADFSGDSMDQRGFMEFTRQVFAKAREKTKPEGVIAVFIDWRNLPALCDSLQAAGWVWRGIAAWHKPNGRPQKGRYRSEFEFVVWGSNGPMPFDRGVGCLPGYYKYPNVASKDRQHQTEKPLQLIQDLMEIVPAGATVLDPFIGSGTTAVAAIRSGRNYIGFELHPEYHATALQRVAAETPSGEAAEPEEWLG
jgi:site-specific DNA-methyltransferase (adenine-specific)